MHFIFAWGFPDFKFVSVELHSSRLWGGLQIEQMELREGRKNKNKQEERENMVGGTSSV